MLEIIFKLLALFLAIYIIWLFTGGPERGIERAERQESSLFIGVDDEERNTILIGN